jgi:endogenous inhibitor of DNA gyrase (YacG/DUF329 family)
MSQRRCPSCKKSVRAKAENTAFPFCSARCKDVDLGRWFGGEYVVSRPLFDLPPEFAMPPSEDDED